MRESENPSLQDRAALSHVWERLQLTHKKDDVVAMIAEGLAEACDRSLCRDLPYTDHRGLFRRLSFRGVP